MHITLSPMRGDSPLSLARQDDRLIVAGTCLDFSDLPEGETLARETFECPFLASDVTRTNGEVHLTLILPHGPDAPHESLFPAPLDVRGNGPVTLPPYGAPETFG